MSTINELGLILTIKKYFSRIFVVPAEKTPISGTQPAVMATEG